MKNSSIVLFFLLLLWANVAVVQGGYSVEPYSPQAGPSDTLGADGTVSFLELPIWIQITWIVCTLIAIFGMIKFGPFILGKVRTFLQNKNRNLLLEYIERHPGCTISDLSKNTGINRGTARYHMYLLVIERKIVQRKFGKLSYLFTNGGRPLEKKRVYGYIMNPTKQQILAAILNHPGISNKQIADRLFLKRNTVHWHLKQFLDEKMVISQWDGRNFNYVLLPEVEEILREYGQKDP